MKALLLIDIQNDFLPGGSLAVKEGNTIIPIVNNLMNNFEIIIATKDWHPGEHGSFANNHTGKKIGEVINLNGLQQILWPSHCIQNTKGSDFAPGLSTKKITKIIYKGTDTDIDSYSGFFDNGHKKATGLDDYLKEKNIKEVHLTGLATDYCVKFTALDAISLGYKTILHLNACKGVELHPGDIEKAITDMKTAGVEIIK